MTQTAYQPRTDLTARLVRRSARFIARRTVTPQLERGLISLSFDDCPRSVFETALPMIEARGWRATIYASIGLCGTTNHLGLHMDEDDLVCAHEAGHEIGDHTYSHIDSMTAGRSATLKDIASNRDGFQRLGLPGASTFAYPYGEVTPALKRALSGEFNVLRGIHDPSGPKLDLNLAASVRLYSDHIQAALDHIRQAKRQKSWLILFGHDVRETPSPYGCTPGELDTVLSYIDTLDLDVVTVRDGYTRAIR